MPRKGEIHPARGKPRPHTWKVGTDPLTHKQYLIWLQQKNQAQWREEGWDLDFEVWRNMWKDKWDLRGRERGSYCMSRKDWSLPWTKENTCVLPREEHGKLQGKARAAGWRSIAYKKKVNKETE